MDLFLIKHGDISKMDMDEARMLKSRIDKTNKTTVRICTFFLIPVAMISIFGTTRFILQIFGLSMNFELINIYPLLLLVALTLSLVRIKYDDFKGYAFTAGLYLSLLLTGLFWEIYLALFLFSLIPMFFVLRSMFNYKILKELKLLPGYPFFIYTVAEKLAGDIYIREEAQKADEDYIPWNAFDDSSSKNENSDKEHSND
ncbi:MAG: hypothetical protein BWY46_00701 [Firmicutes bacterium ADurb.Bin300]|nr:MAG: hypothetical protein BWY46_00701 [Firmicutes bacterium ADurb.Bin300]